jgi:hypothetical protein
MLIKEHRRVHPPSGTIVYLPDPALAVPASADRRDEVDNIVFDLDSDLREGLVVDENGDVTELKFFEENQITVERGERHSFRVMVYASGGSYDFHIDLKFSDGSTVTVNNSEASWRINGYQATYERSYSVDFGDGEGEEDRLVPCHWPEECVGLHSDPDDR